MSIRSSTIPAALVAAAMAVAGAMPIAWLEVQPRNARDVAVVFAPWADRDHAFLQVVRAGGQVVRTGIMHAILVAHADDPGFVGRLYAEGAWVVLDPGALAACLGVRPAGRTTRQDDFDQKAGG